MLAKYHAETRYRCFPIIDFLFLWFTVSTNSNHVRKQETLHVVKNAMIFPIWISTEILDQVK